MLSTQAHLTARLSESTAKAEKAEAAGDPPSTPAKKLVALETPKDEIKSERKTTVETSELPKWVYFIEAKIDPTRGISVPIFGCFGDGGAEQKAVAHMINAHYEKSGEPPSFVLTTGDNVYPSGSTSKSDPAFQTYFYDVYNRLDLPFLRQARFFMSAGNHDHDVQRRLLRPQEGRIDISKIRAQIEHTFLDEKGEPSPAIEKLFQGSALPLNKLGKWNFPNPFYVLAIPELKLFYVIIDSSLIIKDFIEYKKHEADPNDKKRWPEWMAWCAENRDRNQVLWLQEVMRFFTGWTCALCLHHAPKTFGKRIKDPDTNQYLTMTGEGSDIAYLSKLGITGNYNDIIYTTLFVKLGLRPYVVFTAHDHSLFALNDLDLFMFLTGGGSGKLHDRYGAIDRSKMPFYIKHPGYVNMRARMNADKLEMIFDIHTINGHHIQITKEEGRLTLHKEAPDEKGIDELRKIVLTACDKYFLAHPPEPSFAGYVPCDALSGENLFIHFNCYESLRLDTTIDYIRTQLANSPTLTTFLTAELLVQHQLTLKNVLDTPREFLEKIKPIDEKVIPTESPKTPLVDVSSAPTGSLIYRLGCRIYYLFYTQPSVTLVVEEKKMDKATKTTASPSPPPPVVTASASMTV